MKNENNFEPKKAIEIDDHTSYNFLFETMEQAVIYHNAKGVIISANPAAEKLLGMSIDFLLGKTPIDLGTTITKTDGTLFPKEELPVFEVLRNKKPVQNIIIGFKNMHMGENLWLLSSAWPIRPKENPNEVLVMATFTDITARINEENYIKSLNTTQVLLTHITRKLINVKEEEIDAEIGVIFKEVGQYLDVDRVYLFKNNHLTQTTTNTHEWCADGINPGIETMQEVPITAFPEDWVNKNKQGEPYIIRDVIQSDLNEEQKAILVHQGVQSLITLPLMENHICTGFIGLDSVKKKQQFTNLEITLLNGLAASLVNVFRRFQVENNYKKLFDHSPDAYLIVKNEIFTDCNEAAAKMIGGTKSDIIGKKPHEISPKFQQNGKLSETLVKEVVSDALKNGKNNFEWQHIKVDGTIFWVSVSLALIKSDNESILLTSWRNITENKKISDELAQSEARFKLISEHSKAVIWETDMDGKYTYLNNLSELVYGYLPEELIGKYFFDLHPEESRESYKKAGQELLKQGIKLVDFENPIVRKDGKHIWVATNGTPKVNNEGEYIGYIGSDVEITSKKIALDELRKFRIISDQAYFGAAITSIDGDIMYINHAFAAMHGYTEEELMGKNLAVFHTEEQMKQVVPLLTKIKTEGGFDLEEVGHVKKDGTTFPTLMTAKLIKNDQNEPQFLSTTLIDITERKKIEQEILDLNQNLDKKIKARTIELEKSNLDLFYARVEAEESNKSKSEFLSRMSHELRTPMNSILGFAQLMQMSELTPSLEKSVNHILKSGQHLLNLINEVLNISRIESGKLSISIEPVQLNNIVNEVGETLVHAASEKNISLLVQTEETENLYVKADKQRLKQILINILNNAIKYNKLGGKVWLNTQLLDSTKIRISVKDTGAGIEQKNLSKIFSPFERIGAEKTTVEGTGLGLAVVKQLADLMHSEIGVSSELEVGSTFWVDIPICTQTIIEEVIVNLPDTSETLLPEVNGTILYIEDNQTNIELVTQVVKTKRKGINLISNMYGKNAIDLCLAHKPDLILLDLHLPDMHGNEVASNIISNSETKDIPIVVISADILSSNIKFLNGIGVKKFMPKPIDIKELLETIDNYIK